MLRPLRSLLIGDLDFYPSEFAFGVNQGMTLLGHWHTTVNVRQDLDTIWRRAVQMRPDVIWGHMLLWAPPDASKTEGLLELCRTMRRRYGTKTIIHDGDAREEIRYPHDISDAVDLVLCNHTADRSLWKIQQQRWPYFAFVQKEMAAPVPELTCQLAFAGRFGDGIYKERTQFIRELKTRVSMRVFVPNEGDQHTLMMTPELATSAGTVLGWGRPESPGWTDVRVFQYPGAGAVLLHDDVQGYLEPDVHYLPVVRGNVDSVLEALARAHTLESAWDGSRIRRQAFRYVQEHHTSVHRVGQALGWIER
jgi:hypothetical protein